MKKILGLAGAIALSIIPTPSFSGEVEQKEMMSVTEQLLPQIGEKYKNLDIKEAVKVSLEKVKKSGGSGGVIAIDKYGNYAMEFNTKGMYRGVKDSRGNFKVSIFKND